MASKQISLPDIGTVTLYKKRGNTNIRLSFTRDGSLRVSLPYWLPYQAGVQFALSKKDWIIKHQPERPVSLRHSDRIGKAHRLVINPGASGQKATVRVARNLITVSCPANTHPEHQTIQAAAVRGAIKALKLEAEALLPQRLDQLARRHGFSYASCEIKRLSSRWGSCGQQKNITLNLFLMQLPWQLIDYVLLHELTHTEHLNHSDGFWQRFEQVLPGAKSFRKQLKEHRTMIVPA